MEKYWCIGPIPHRFSKFRPENSSSILQFDWMLASGDSIFFEVVREVCLSMPFPFMGQGFLMIGSTWVSGELVSSSSCSQALILSAIKVESDENFNHAMLRFFLGTPNEDSIASNEKNHKSQVSRELLRNDSLRRVVGGSFALVRENALQYWLQGWELKPSNMKKCCKYNVGSIFMPTVKKD